MKKIYFLLSGCLLLGACVSHETDLEAAQIERDATLYQKRAQEGCQFVRDQDAYRECILSTYNATHPATYKTAELINGQPIAIISSPDPCGQKNATEQVAPLPSAEPEVVSFATQQTMPAQAEMPPMPVYQPAPAKAVVVEEEVMTQMPLPNPVETPVVQQAPVVPPAPMMAPAPVQEPGSWWQAHQDDGMAKGTKPTCPCPDPNDPCPQCYEK